MRKLYDPVSIAGKTQLDGEDAYVLALGTDTKLYVAARTNLVVRRDRGAESTRFFDFRNIAGGIVPFQWVTDDGLGEKTVRVDKIEFGITAPASTFAPIAHFTR